MSQIGIRGFYQLTEQIKTQLLADVNVNTVTTGDIFDIDLSKQSIFPLSHIIINNVITQENVLVFNITVMSMDIVDESKEKTDDIFVGNNNEQDVLNTQLAVLNKLIMVLRKKLNRSYTMKFIKNYRKKNIVKKLFIIKLIIL